MVPSHPGDAVRIAQLIREGDEQGFVLLLREYGGRVAGYLRRRFPSFDDQAVHDLLVDAVLALAKTYDPLRGTLGAWLLLLAHQGAVRRLRARRGDRCALPLDIDVAADQCSPLGELIDRERLDEVTDAMASLTSLERAVVEADLEEGEAADAKELARQFGTTAGSVYAARRRGRSKLLNKLTWLSDSQ